VLSLAAYGRLFGTPRILSLLGSTFLFAVASALMGLVLGGTLAWIVERTDAPMKRVVYFSTFVLFAVPGVLRVIGWILLAGPRTGLLNSALRQASNNPDATLFDAFSLPTMILVEGTFWTPLAFLMLSAVLHSMDPSLEEAATMSGAGIGATIRRITVRLALPGVLSALLLMFLRSLQAFEVPLFLGVPGNVYLLTTEVYLAVGAGTLPDYSYASAYGVLLVSLLAAGLFLYGRLTGDVNRFVTISGKGFRPRTIHLGPMGRTAASIVILAILGLQLGPILCLLFFSFLPTAAPSARPWEQLTLQNYRMMLDNPVLTLSLRNSLVIAFVSATVVAILAGLIAWLTVRTRLVESALLGQLANLPLVFPGVVMGVAMLMLYVGSPLRVYGTIWLIVIAYVASFLPFGLRYAHPGLLQIGAELEESAHMSGAGQRQVLMRIVFPLLVPALFAGWIFIFLMSVRELAVVALLYTAQTPVVATTLLGLWREGTINQMSAFAAIVAVASIGVGTLVYRFSSRWGLQA
jgi:iron(III) transport system permease protein